MGLMILSTTLVLTLHAASVARRTALAAAQAEQADEVLRGLLLTLPIVPGEVRGASGQLSWSLSTQPQGMTVQGVRLCDRAASVRITASGRRYGLSTVELCPERSGA